jgi:hypothetical protein
VLAFNQNRSRFDGIGFAFSAETPYVGIDFDECVFPDEDNFELTDLATRVVDSFATYTELSPSQTGIHLIGKAGDVQATKRKWQGKEVEVYRTGRYFTFTGRSWHESPLGVADVDAKVRKLIEMLRSNDAKAEQPAQVASSIPVQKRIEMALRNPKIESLFYGNTLEYGGDDSKADLALCSKLAFYSGGSEELLDAMFRQSRLMRAKWDENRGGQTYGQLTLNKALSSQTQFLGSTPVERVIKQHQESTEETRKVRRFTINDLREETMAFRKEPAAQGVHPGWDELAKLYRPGPGHLSIVTGEPGSGKTNWVDCLVYNIAKRSGWRTTFASFETLPIQRHLLNLCQIHLQKPTFDFVPGAATDDEMNQAMDEMQDWFNFILPTEEEMNIEAILEFVADDIREFGVQGFVLDPFTELEQESAKNIAQTERIESILRRLQQFTRSRQIHTWLIAHPTKSGDTYKDGRPTMRSISGSAHFYNKADFGVVVHRLDDDRTTVFLDKVKFDSNGEKGEVTFHYSKDRREYYTEAVEEAWEATTF